MNPNNPYLNKPLGKPASMEYLISNGIERNPVIEREISPDKKIPQGLPSPDISTRASIEYILDNNLDFNPVFESRFKNGSSDARTSGEDLDEILSQYIEGYDINDYIKNGDQDESAEKDKNGRVNGMLSLPPATETPTVSGNGSEGEDDVIIEDDEVGNESPVSSILFANIYDQAEEDDVKIDSEDDIEESESATHDVFGTPEAPGSLADSELEKATRPKSSSEEDSILIEAEANKAGRSKRKNILTKSLAALIVVSSLFAATKILESDKSEVISTDNTEQPTTTTTPTTTPKTPKPTSPDTPDKAIQNAIKTSIYGETSKTVMGDIITTDLDNLDASEIEASGKVWPWTNVTEAGADDPVASIESALNLYNQVNPNTHFELREDGMFWTRDGDIDRIINPSELEEYNRLMKIVAENS